MDVGPIKQVQIEEPTGTRHRKTKGKKKSEVVSFSNSKVKAKGLILRGAVCRYAEASDTGENISQSGSFSTSVLGI